MNWVRIESNWDDIRERFAVRWTRLSQEDFIFINGDRKLMEIVLQQRYANSKDEVSREIDDWINSDAFEDFGQTPEAIRSSH